MCKSVMFVLSKGKLCPFTCMCQAVSFEHVSLGLVLVEGFPLGAVWTVVLQVALVQMGIEPNFVVQV